MVNLISFDIKSDHRGNLVALEENTEIPFKVQRVFYIYGAETGIRRGCHAHKTLLELAICVRGSCKVQLDNGYDVSVVAMDSPDKGLLIESMTWTEIFDFSDDCVLLVLASELYHQQDYILDYEAFVRQVKKSHE